MSQGQGQDSVETLRQALASRDQELSDAYEYQAAISDILNAISQAPGETQKILAAIVDSACLLCQAYDASILLRDGDHLVLAAHRGPIPIDFDRFPLSRGWVTGRAVIDGRAVQVADLIEAGDDFPEGRAMAQRMGHRTSFGTPLIQHGKAIGAISLRRKTVKPFSDRQINLLQTFASQAVIALQNARHIEQIQKQSLELKRWSTTLEEKVAAQVSEIDRVNRLRQFLSPHIAEAIIEAGNESLLGSHRRDITIAFCDLRGFTGFVDSVEPEDVMEMLRDYHCILGNLVNKYEGTVERFTGDGLMVWFNDPLPCPDHSIRAATMAVEMRRDVNALLASWNKLGFNLGFSMGMARGFATLGKIGFEERFDYAAVGTAVNLAARLCARAEADQILIDSKLAAALESHVAMEFNGEGVLKGLHRQSKFYNIISMKDAKARGSE